MIGGLFEASNDPTFSTGIAMLYKITTQPSDGLITQPVTGTYRYVRYVSPAGSYGNIAEMQVFGPGTTTIAVPAAPGKPTLSSSTSTTATIAWTASPSVGVTGYIVLRNGVQIGTTDSATFTYSDLGLSPSTAYTYTIEAATGTVDSVPSGPLVVTTPVAPPLPPGTPTLVSSTTTTATIAWTASTSTGITGYIILRNGVQVGTTNSTTLTFPDTGLSASTNYTYTVEAVANAQDSAPSASLVVTTATPAPTAPGTPTLVSDTSSTATIAWTASTSTGITGYIIFRNGVQVGTTNSTTLTFPDTGLSASTKYTYTVEAVASALDSVPSASLVITTPAAPIAPTAPGTPTLVSVTSTTATITWTASPSTGIIAYAILRNGVQVGTTTSTTFTFSDYPLNPSTTYSYTIEAVAGPLTSVPSGALSVKTAASTATKLTGTIIGTPGSYDGKSTDAASAVFDGNLNTFFDAPTAGTTASPNWVGLDLGASYNITSISYAPRNGGYESRMVGGIFQVSNSPTFATGVVNLYTITTTPADGLTTIPVTANGYRYIRYLAPNGSYGNVAELQFFGTPTIVSKQLTGTSSANTTASYDGKTTDNYTAAFDGNTSTSFDAPTANGNYLQLDLGAAHTITQIAYAPRVGYESRMVGGYFEASNDPTFSTGVTVLYTITQTPPDGLTTQAITAAGTFRYVRYVAPAGSYGNIAEMQVFG
jgi:chitodextrinase